MPMDGHQTVEHSVASGLPHQRGATAAPLSLSVEGLRIKVFNPVMYYEFDRENEPKSS